MCIDLEHECTEIERSWRERCEMMEKDIGEWKKKYLNEVKKGDRLREQISRTEKELYGILQRKYELMRGPGGAPIQGTKPSKDTSRNNLYEDNDTGAAFNNLAKNEQKSSQDIRQRKTMNSLCEFLGI